MFLKREVSFSKELCAGRGCLCTAQAPGADTLQLKALTPLCLIVLSPWTAVKLNSLILEGSWIDCRYISTSTAFNSGFHKGPIAAGISAERLTKFSASLLEENYASSSTSLACRCLKGIAPMPPLMISLARKRRNNLLMEKEALQCNLPSAEMSCGTSCLSPKSFLALWRGGCTSVL